MGTVAIHAIIDERTAPAIERAIRCRLNQPRRIDRTGDNVDGA
jgi:hypothetical protein